jgi:hypothetical protein
MKEGREVNWWSGEMAAPLPWGVPTEGVFVWVCVDASDARCWAWRGDGT